jgi:ferredoxin
MGHISLKDSHYRLQQRLDQHPVGAPAHPALFDILKLLFSEDEATIAAQMPFGFSSTRRLARVLGRDEQALQPVLESMADRGLLFDLLRKGRSYWYLNPLVIGFFEFTMMRVRQDLDQKQIAHKMYEYMFEDPALAFIREVGTGGETQLFRPLVHEENLPEDYVEVLDYERATHLVQEANAWTVGLCHCRHVALHRGVPCTHSVGGREEPMEVCMSFGEPAQYFARRGMGRAIEKAEALDILQGAKAAGLVQLGDNVQRRPTFICNCCDCCCELLEGYRRVKETPFLQTSSYEPVVDHDGGCNRCGVCVKACPINALELAERPDAPPSEERTGPGWRNRTFNLQVDRKYCLGCGVCATKCNRDAITMQPRTRKVHTPETTIERVMLMALERGKLQNLVFDQPRHAGHAAMRTFLKVVLTMPPTKQLLANQQLKSRFVKFLVKKASSRPGADA